VAGATQEQVIKVVYEATEAERAARARSMAEQKRIKDEAEVAKKAAKEVSDAHKNAAKEASDAQKKAAKEASDAAKKVLADEKSTAAERRAADKTLQEQMVRETKERVNQQIREAKRLASEEQKAAVEAQRAKAKAADEAAAKLKSADAAALGATKAALGFGAAMLGMNSASAAMAAIWERFNLLRAAAIEGGNKMLAQAVGMRSLSSVMGQTGQPSLTQVEMLRMASKTMQSPEDAAAMMQAAMGKGFGAVEAGLVSKEELQKAAVYQGKRQTLYGESPEAMGMILGMLPMMSEKKGQTGEEIEALNQRLDEIRKLAGYKNYAQAVSQVEKVSPYVLKGIYTGPMAMALTGASALAGSPEEAGTHLEQATTAVTVGMMRARKMKVDPADEHQYQTTAAYFRGLKSREGKAVTDQMPAHERILAVVDDVIRAEDEARKAGKHFEGTLYLTQQGFINQEHMLALTGLAGVERKGLLRPLINAGLAPVEPHVAGKGIDVEFGKAERDPAMADLFAQRETELAEQAEFAKNRFRLIQGRAAYSRLGGKGKFGETFEQSISKWDTDWYEAIWEPRRKIEMEAQRKIMDEATAAGVKLDPMLGRGARPGSQNFIGWEKLFDISEQTGAKGGRILPGINDADNARNLARIAENTDRLLGIPPVGQPVNPVIGQHVQAGRAPVPAPLPARPMGLPGRAP